MSDPRTPLDTEIRERIGRHGPMPVADFMALCLYDLAHGYYNRRDTIGAAGDFVTAPEISQMFGELIGLWAAMAWQAIGAPAPVQLIELGPGRGTLMADALRAMRTAPEFRRAVRVHLVETSSEMQLRQRETLGDVEDIMLRWHASLDEVPQGAAIIIANEFFDALPVQQIERCLDGWHERAIAVNSGDELALTVMPEPLAGIEESLPAAVSRGRIGDIFEWRDADFAVHVGRRVAAGGAALIIDYGHIKSAVGDTFQAVRRHRYASPMALPGLTDLTAHVDFEALTHAAEGAGARVHGPIDQAALLKALSIEARAAILVANAPSEGQAAIKAGLQRLIGTGPGGMGAQFKALGLSPPHVRQLPGFAR